MFSDTHFHFNILREDENFSRISILKKMAQNGCKFALDVGVKADDFFPRIKLFEYELSKIENPLRKKIEEFIFFSAGIWPDPDSIKNRAEKISLLEKTISEIKSNSEKSDSAKNAEGDFFLGEKLVALGECGLDHHWNVAGPDARSEADFDQDLLFGERELFEAQISLAKKFSLPMIVHSRDAAAQTLECVKNSNFHNGIIHCFSYGLEEARIDSPRSRRKASRGNRRPIPRASAYARQSQQPDFHRTHLQIHRRHSRNRSGAALRIGGKKYFSIDVEWKIGNGKSCASRKSQCVKKTPPQNRTAFKIFATLAQQF